MAATTRFLKGRRRKGSGGGQRGRATRGGGAGDSEGGGHGGGMAQQPVVAPGRRAWAAALPHDSGGRRGRGDAGRRG
jgi:hypothetical protein